MADPKITIELVEGGTTTSTGGGGTGQQPTGGQGGQTGNVAGDATTQGQAAEQATQLGAIAQGLGFPALGGALGKGGALAKAAGKVGALFGGGAAGGGAAGTVTAATPGAVAAIGATGPLAPIVAAVVASVAVAALATKVGLMIADKRERELAFASPEIQIAQARTELADIQSRIRRARALGGTLGGIREERGNVGRDIAEIADVVLAPMLEVLKDLLVVIRTFTEPLSDFLEEHRDLISKGIKFLFNIIVPMTAVIEWWADLAGRARVDEIGDPIAEMIAIVNGQPVDPGDMGRERAVDREDGIGLGLLKGFVRAGKPIQKGVEALFGLDLK